MTRSDSLNEIKPIAVSFKPNKARRDKVRRKGQNCCSYTKQNLFHAMKTLQ